MTAKSIFDSNIQNRHILRRMLAHLFCIFLFIGVSATNNVQAGADPTLFPRPAAIDPAVKFWVKVFSKIDTKHGYIHDDWNLNVIYEEFHLSTKYSRKKNKKRIKAAKKRYKRILLKLAKGKRTGLNKEERRILNLWPKDVSNKTLRRATKRIRFQLGQSNKFVDGLKRSGAWRSYILANLKKKGLPREIAALPHVESSFNPKAYSSVGAAGLWQFTRSTGRRYMRVDHVVDERMDPFKASIAAAQLLENNYAVTGTWPLAMTAYNHGAAGMRRAARQVGSKDIDKIIFRYKSRSFKFASRNFYTAFLAVNDIQDDLESYFGKVIVNAPVKDKIITVPAYMSVKSLSKALGLSKKELKRKNPALRPAVWNNTKYVPKGYKLRVTPGSVRKDPKKALLQVASNKRFKKQKPDAYHRVRRGQTLSTIAARYGVRVRDIASINNIRRRNRIRIGQVLRLPQSGKRYTATKLAKANGNKKSNNYKKRLNRDGFYKVRRGDSIYKIAKRFRIKQKQLLALNGLKRRKPIYPGQMLLVNPKKQKKVAPVTIAKLDVNKTSKVANSKPTQVVTASTQATSTEANSSSDNQTEKNEQALNLISTKISTDIDAKAEQNTKSEEALISHLPAVAEAKMATNNEIEQPVPLKAPPTVTVVKQSNLFQIPIEVEVNAENDSANDNPPTSTPGNASTGVGKATESEIEALETAAMQEKIAALFADPSDYSVSANKTIEIQASETLGHYAEWLGLRASRLRRINKMRFRTPVVVGQRLKLDFRKVPMVEFEKQRLEYHKSLQETYFEKFQITGTDKHKVRRGESLWKLAKRKYKIPIWLLRQYNPDLAFKKVKAGMYITFPSVIKRRPNSSS